MLVRGFLAKNKTVIMAQPPYSPVWGPADFILFPKLMKPMEGKRFATIEEIKENRNRSCWRYQFIRYVTHFISISRIGENAGIHTFPVGMLINKIVVFGVLIILK